MFSGYQHHATSFSSKIDLSDIDPRWQGHEIVNALHRLAHKLAPRFSDECAESSCTNSRPGADQPRRQQVWDMHAEALGWNLIADDPKVVAAALAQEAIGNADYQPILPYDHESRTQHAHIVLGGRVNWQTEDEVTAGKFDQPVIAIGEVAPADVEVPLTKFQAGWLEDVAMSGSESYAAAEAAGVRIVGHNKPRLIIPPAAAHHIGVAIGVRSDIADEGHGSIGERRSILALAAKVAAATGDRTALPLAIPAPVGLPAPSPTPLQDALSFEDGFEAHRQWEWEQANGGPQMSFEAWLADLDADDEDAPLVTEVAPHNPEICECEAVEVRKQEQHYMVWSRTHALVDVSGWYGTCPACQVAYALLLPADDMALYQAAIANLGGSYAGPIPRPQPGDRVEDFRGDVWIFDHVSRPYHPGKSAKVVVHRPGSTSTMEFYAQVFEDLAYLND